MRPPTLLAVVIAIVSTAAGFARGQAAPPAGAGEKKPAAGSVDLKAALNDLHVQGETADFWVYNDLPAAIAEAKRTNRPIFVTFRCVPCKACAGFDAEVAKGSEGIGRLARDKFVSLRQVE